MQAQFCDNRICDNRKIALHRVVDREEIKARIKARGLRQHEVAAALGISQVKVSRSLGGERQWKVHEMDALRRLLTEGEPERHPVRSVPVIGMVAAGNWREAVQRSSDVLPVADPRLPPRAFALQIVGDSMDLLVEDGGYVIVDPDDKALFPNRYYVIVNGEGETTFKRFKADPARLIPCSTNPAHEEIPIGGSPFEVVGRVIWQSSRL